MTAVINPKLNGHHPTSMQMRNEALVCALLTVGIVASYWPDSVLPYHDSLFKYQFFHFVYSQAITSGDIPMWVPYGNYGMAATLYQLLTLTPASYLVGAVGAATGAGNTLLLYKLGVFLEVAFYAMGLVTLGRSLYEHALSRMVVFFGGMCSLSWLLQPDFNFHAFYLYPYLLVFLFDFLRTGNPAKLWLGTSVGLLSLIGTSLYFAPLHLFVLTVLVCVALVSGARPPSRRSLGQWLFCREAGVAATLGAIVVTAAWFGVQEIITISDGREPDSNRVPLRVFLEYGRTTPLTVANGYLSGAATHGDNTYYIGLLPLVLVILGVSRLRHPFFLGVAAAALALIWLSIGGYFSMLVYSFPAMWLFRHIGLTYGLSGLLLLIVAGRVVDELINRSVPPSPSDAEPPRRQRLIIWFIVALMFLDIVASWRKHDWNLYPSFHESLLVLIPLRVAGYFAALAIVRWRRQRFIRTRVAPGWIWTPLVVAYLFDVGSFQAAVLVTAPRAGVANSVNAFKADVMPYRETRSAMDFADPSLRWKLILLNGRTAYTGAVYANAVGYAFSYTFMGADPCYPRLRNDVWQRGVYDALTARGGHPRQLPGADFLPRNDPSFTASLGCGDPKMGLIDSFVRANSGLDARSLLKSVPNPHQTLVLEVPAGSPDHQYGAFAVPSIARVAGFRSNRVEIDIVNGRDHPVWLYYADAFHSEWRARVDGVRTDVIRANVGFKAVRVPPGRHSVVLTFGEGTRRIVTWLLAIVGGVACAIGLIFAIITFLRYRPVQIEA